jgi:hypothetical protein
MRPASAFKPQAVVAAAATTLMSLMMANLAPTTKITAWQVQCALSLDASWSTLKT